MISGSSVLRKYLAWYDFRILYLEKVCRLSITSGRLGFQVRTAFPAKDDAYASGTASRRSLAFSRPHGTHEWRAWFLPSSPRAPGKPGSSITHGNIDSKSVRRAKLTLPEW